MYTCVNGCVPPPPSKSSVRMCRTFRSDCLYLSAQNYSAPTPPPPPQKKNNPGFTPENAIDLICRKIDIRLAEGHLSMHHVRLTVTAIFLLTWL